MCFPLPVSGITASLATCGRQHEARQLHCDYSMLPCKYCTRVPAGAGRVRARASLPTIPPLSCPLFLSYRTQTKSQSTRVLNASGSSRFRGDYAGRPQQGRSGSGSLSTCDPVLLATHPGHPGQTGLPPPPPPPSWQRTVTPGPACVLSVYLEKIPILFDVVTVTVPGARAVYSVDCRISG